MEKADPLFVGFVIIIGVGLLGGLAIGVLTQSAVAGVVSPLAFWFMLLMVWGGAD